MVAGWTRFGEDECPQCLSTRIERGTCQRCGASVYSAAAATPSRGRVARAAYWQVREAIPYLTITLSLAVLLVFVTYFSVKPADNDDLIQNYSCVDNCSSVGNQS